MIENRALREWMETSRRKNDFMEMGCLTEVTDSYKDHRVIAYIVPIKRNSRGLVTLKVLWLDENVKITRVRLRTYEIRYDTMIPHHTNITLFDSIGKDFSCVPYYNMWIHYHSITDRKKLPMYIGIDDEVDEFIAQELIGTR